MRLLVCGGRDYDNKDLMRRILQQFYGGIDVLIHGAAKGADMLANETFQELNDFANIEPYPANWTTYGKSAGPIRNRQMLEEGKPDLVLAFPGGKGTRDMINQAKKAGIPVLQVLE